MAVRISDSPFQGVPSTPCIYTFKQYTSPAAEVPDTFSQRSPVTSPLIASEKCNVYFL